MNAFLYIGTIFIWGSTWLAIAFQVSDVAVEVSAFYRFALAALIQVCLMAALGKLPWIPLREHTWFIVQGWLLFCFNFLLFYNASIYTTSGLIAVVFSMSTIFNIVNGYLFHQKIPTKRAVFGAALGVIGVCAIFWEDIFDGHWSGDNITGLMLALGGTYCFSLGNLVSQHV